MAATGLWAALLTRTQALQGQIASPELLQFAHKVERDGWLDLQRRLPTIAQHAVAYALVRYLPQTLLGDNDPGSSVLHGRGQHQGIPGRKPAHCAGQVDGGIEGPSSMAFQFDDHCPAGPISEATTQASQYRFVRAQAEYLCHACHIRGCRVGGYAQLQRLHIAFAVRSCWKVGRHWHACPGLRSDAIPVNLRARYGTKLL